jgi:hypothetical protein
MSTALYESSNTISDTNTGDTTRSLTAKITHYLRWAGSILIIISAISFMLLG